MTKGRTVNLCAIDVSKAFDRVNNFALLNKLMKRVLPVKVLSLFEKWLLNCHSCIKINGNPVFHNLSNWSLELDKAQSCLPCYLQCF